MMKRFCPYGAWAALAFALGGCVTLENLTTADADLARQVIAEHCVTGTWMSSDGRNQHRVEKLWLGKVSKRVDPITFRSFLAIHAERIYVHAVRALDDGWIVADASSDGVRENVYINRTTGAFACSTDEWRAVRGFPKRLTFETSPLIK